MLNEELRCYLHCYTSLLGVAHLEVAVNAASCSCRAANGNAPSVGGPQLEGSFRDGSLREYIFALAGMYTGWNVAGMYE